MIFTHQHIPILFFKQDGYIDNQIRMSLGVSILLYSGGGAYIHYVMVETTVNGFLLYNRASNISNPELQTSIDDWLASTNRTPLAIIHVPR